MAIALNKYTYSLYAQYTSGGNWVEVKKGLTLDQTKYNKGVYEISPYHFDVTTLETGTTVLNFKMVGLADTGVPSRDLTVKTGNGAGTAVSYATYHDVSTQLTSYNEKYDIVYSDTNYSSGAAIDLKFTIYFDYDPYIFTYNLYYLADAGLSTPIASMTKLLEKRAVQAVYSYLYEGKFDCMMQLLNTNKKLLIVITRSEITGSSIVESEVYRNSFDLYTFGYKYCFEFTDYNYSGIISKTSSSARSYTFLMSVNTFYSDEYAPLSYRVERINFDNTPSKVQYVDMTVKNSAGTVVFSKTKMPVAPNGKLLDDTLLKYRIYDLGKVFADGEAYTITTYHYEMDKTIVQNCIAPTALHIGDNPVWNKIEYGGKPVVIVTTSDITRQSQIQPNDKIGEWYFDLSNSTHGLGVAAGGIIYPGDNNNITDFHFKTATSTGNAKEVYTGIEMSTSNYIKLPNNYYKENYEDFGFSSNVWAKSIFGHTADVVNDTDDTTNTCRTLYFKFFIESSHSTDVTLIDLYNTNMGSASSVRYKMNINLTYLSIIKIKGSTSTTVYTGNLNNSVKVGNWYTLIMTVNKGIVKFINISDYSNYKNTAYSPGIGFGYKPGEVSDTGSTYRIASNKSSDTFAVNYTYSGITGEVAIRPLVTIYQYAESTTPISVNTEFSGISLINGTSRTDSVNIVTEGYSVVLGLKICIPKGGTTSSGALTINSITFNGNVISGPFITNFKDTGINNVFSITDGTIIGSSYSIAKTSETLGNPIGGLWLSPNLDMSDIVDTYLTKDNFTTTGDWFGLGDINMSNYGVIIGKIGMVKRTCSSAPSIEYPYEFIPASYMELLSNAYSLIPSLGILYSDSSKNIVLGMDYIKELKSQQIIYNLPMNIETGKCTFQLTVGNDIYYTKEMTIGHVKPDDSTCDFDCNFETDYDNAVTLFKKRFYAKQKLWGGELGGGDNGNLIYADKGNGCIVLEQHGDYYQGNIPACEKQSGDYWYGGPAPLLQYPLDTDGTKVLFYNSDYAPDAKKCRTIRTGGLIQSSDYYGYGTWDIWFKSDIGLDGAAICWWTFHYQELYTNDTLYDFYLEQNVHNYYIGGKSANFNYLYTAKSPGTTNAYIIVNNEIDMEIGSEANQYTVPTNPNSDGSLRFYLPAIDEHTVVGCTSSGADYGLWMIDWANSQDALNERYNSIANLSGSSFNPKTGEYLAVPCNNLTWVKVSDTICDQPITGASTRSLRWNNWWTEADAGGVISTVTPVNGKTGASESTPVWDMGNTIGAATLRTPIGKIDITKTNVNDRYVPMYISDGKYHKFTFIWHRDYTQIKIDDVIVKTNKACVPFIPMPILLGCWFPSDNSWGTFASSGIWGTWAGNKAEFDIKHMYVKRIKYTHFDEATCPRTDMLYHPETYPQDGLREIL